MSSVTQKGPVAPDQPASKSSELAEFARGPWFPLVCVLVGALFIVVVLVGANSTVLLVPTLTAYAGVVGTVAGLIAATRYLKR